MCGSRAVRGAETSWDSGPRARRGCAGGATAPRGGARGVPRSRAWRGRTTNTCAGRSSTPWMAVVPISHSRISACWRGSIMAASIRLPTTFRAWAVKMGIPGQAIGLPISRRNERVARHAPHGTLRSLGYDAVKSARVARLEFEARAPTHRRGKRIARQHRHANEADPENAECEEYECEEYECE